MAEAYAFREGAFGQAIVLEAGSDLVAHSHSESQIVFWLGGAKARATVGTETVLYGENTGLGSNANESHDMVLLDESGPAVFLVFMISRTWLNERRRVTGRPFVFPSPRIPIDAALRQACWQVLDLIFSGDESQNTLDDLVERLIIAAIDAVTQARAPDAKPLLPPLIDHRLRAAIALMRTHVSEKLALDDIAARVGLSRAHLFTLFRDQLNTTPQVFWSAVRVEEAMRRLIRERASLTNVALDLGFSAPSNFSRFFKEHTGVSPSTFRRAASGATPATVTGLAG
ncbi:AraC family transcriptional regulator [Telluria mixta]|uniref:AraC family transcriptional regulator n=1 Tax=Telluria mixta TaxID=34071 RepID=A0ABT2C8J5_9BURK|nr:AraC family transcriptional regulator [Telluria mixta]MCS0633727.1 AraC family transcriptional regulator [Telluria mixta]WEM95123.1 AraC family transcriptional regulator [Telluria mixta]